MADDTRGQAVRAAGGRELWQALEQQRDGTAVVAAAGRRRAPVTGRDLVHGADATAAWLRARGVAPGDVVALMLPAGAERTAAAHACWAVGAIAVVHDPDMDTQDIARAQRSERPRFAVIDAWDVGSGAWWGYRTPGLEAVLRLRVGPVTPVARTARGLVGRHTRPPLRSSHRPDADVGAILHLRDEMDRPSRVVTSLSQIAGCRRLVVAEAARRASGTNPAHDSLAPDPQDHQAASLVPVAALLIAQVLVPGMPRSLADLATAGALLAAWTEPAGHHVCLMS